jgi:hypothetical protein
MSEHTDYMKKCAKEAEKMVEVIAVGIMTDAVKDFFKHCVYVQRLSDLPKRCLTEIDSCLRETKKLCVQRY